MVNRWSGNEVILYREWSCQYSFPKGWGKNTALQVTTFKQSYLLSVMLTALGRRYIVYFQISALFMSTKCKPSFMNNVTILLHLWNQLKLCNSLSEMCKQFNWSHNTTLSLVAVSYATNLQRTHYHNKPFSSLCSSLKKTWLKILRVGWETSQLDTINSIQLSLDWSVDCTHCLCIHQNHSSIYICQALQGLLCCHYTRCTGEEWCSLCRQCIVHSPVPSQQLHGRRKEP